MPKIHYPKEQMHRIRYTKLPEQQIAAKLDAARAGPTCASPYSDAGIWKLRRVVYRATASDQAQAIAGRGGQRPRGMTIFSQVYPQDPRGPDALLG